MLSGSGRTLVNLHEVIAAGALHATIALVIASRECLGAQRAREHNIATVIERGRIPRARLQELARGAEADWIILAGYLHMVEIPASHRGRVVNIHPALLPDFGGPGMHGRHVHEAVLKANRHISGCTVHLCDDQYDTGPIILQRTCAVLPGDTPDTLAERVFEEEKIAYPEALRTLMASRGRLA